MPSTVTVIGNITSEPSLQGVEVKTFEQIAAGPLPFIGPNSNPVIVFDGARVDNLISFNDDTVADVNQKKTKMFPNLEAEQRTLGQGISFQSNAPVVDSEGFNPVTWIQRTSDLSIFPETQGNAAYDNIDLYDGIIEPLDLRNRQVDDFNITKKFDLHGIESGISGFANDARNRNIPIISFIFNDNKTVEPFYDNLSSSDDYQLKNFSSFLKNSFCQLEPFRDTSLSEWSFQQLDSTLQQLLNPVRSTTDDLLPIRAISSTSGQIVDLASSPGTDSIAYVGLKR